MWVTLLKGHCPDSLNVPSRQRIPKGSWNLHHVCVVTKENVKIATSQGVVIRILSICAKRTLFRIQTGMWLVTDKILFLNVSTHHLEEAVSCSCMSLEKGWKMKKLRRAWKGAKKRVAWKGKGKEERKVPGKSWEEQGAKERREASNNFPLLIFTHMNYAMQCWVCAHSG